ncbi:MAG: hypothetical protein ACKVOK_08830 [Flavobacteriales bacterium]
MKKILVALAILTSSTFTNAQSDSNYVEIGVNSIRLLQMGIGQTNASNSNWNPYLLTLEGHYKRLGVRVGLGMTNFSQTELPGDANGKVETNIDTTSSDIRVGLNWEFALHKKWTFKLGVDYFTAKRLNRLSTEFVNENGLKVTNSMEMEYTENGVSPAFFFQYHITPRVSLGTELLVRISGFTRIDSDITTFSDSGSSNTELIRLYDGTKRSIMMPTALFLTARF